MTSTTSTTSTTSLRRVPSSADPVELFFDLAFVFSLAQLVAFLHHELTVTTVLQALVLLSLLWWAWSQFTWAANAVGNDTRGVRAVLVGATVAAIPLGASVGQAHAAAGGVFAAGWSALMVAGVALYVTRLADDHQQRRAVVRLTLRTLPGFALVGVGAVLPDPTLRLATWAVAFLSLVAAAALTRGDGFRVGPSHFAERYGLIVIVALGETVVALGLGVVDTITEPGVAATLLAAGLLVGLLWWSYFDRVAPLAEEGLHALDGPARGHLARDVYTYLHLPVVAGIVLVAVALEEVAAHPGDPLPLPLRGALAAGLVLFLGGFVLAAARATRLVLLERGVALVLLAGAVLVAGGVPGLAVVVTVDVALLVALLVEERSGRLRGAGPTGAPAG